MTAPPRLTAAQIAALEALNRGGAHDLEEIRQALPDSHKWGEASANRTQKLLARLETRGLVGHLGRGDTAVYYLTMEGRSVLG